MAVHIAAERDQLGLVPGQEAAKLPDQVILSHSSPPRWQRPGHREPGLPAMDGAVAAGRPCRDPAGGEQHQRVQQIPGGCMDETNRRAPAEFTYRPDAHGPAPAFALPLVLADLALKLSSLRLAKPRRDTSQHRY